MARKELIIQDFSGSMTTNPRENSYGSVLCKHFDNFSEPNALTPYRGSEDVYNSQSTNQLKKFLMWGGNMYLFGRQTSNDRPLLMKNDAIATVNLTTPTNGDSAADTNVSTSELFIEYKGTIYGADSDGLWSYAGTTWTDDAQNITFTSMTQGVIHSQTDILCIGYTNATASYIMTKDGAGAFATTALTLPPSLKINSICEYGNFLAVGCAPITNDGRSKVFLWDMVSADVSESYDLGNTTLKVLEVVDGNLIAICNTITPSTATNVQVSFHVFNGQKFKRIKVLQAGGNSSVGLSKQEYNGRLYFTIDGNSVGGSTDDWTGVWSCGFNQNNEFTVVMSYVADNDTVAAQIYGFIIVQEYAYISYLDSGAAVAMSKIDDQATNVSATAVYETLKYNCGDINKRKKLIGISVSSASVPAADKLIISYKIDTETSYTQISKRSVPSKISRENVAIDTALIAAGKGLPEFHEVQFKIESQGVKVTGLRMVYEEKDGMLDTK